ncbi:TraR/DksA family transcriptional regulator [Bdellovibrio sp. HCB337]|uniref:TraR/DksA family transcriptional regulator n=1 Tax=Bdellovibrio sp. HCB337 TaxID=3394358 RepID=UPI0039A44A98
MKTNLSPQIISECRKKLTTMKQDILNRVRMAQLDFGHVEKSSGDEVDQTVAQLAENHFLIAQERMRTQLLEIEQALARIENGTYGICEETEEPIEVDRLFAVPWTRLSIEGAEIQEAMLRKFAR